jgi:DNA-binding transcriptional LysR family regulator
MGFYSFSLYDAGMHHPPVDKQRFDISLEDLQTFLLVADLGSFSDAARQLNLSQPSVSNRVRRLEEKLGTKLLDRTTRRVELTPPGARLHVQAVSTLQSLRNLCQEFLLENSARNRQLDVAATMMVATVALPTIVKKFTEKRSDIVVRVQDRFPDSALQAVRSGICDMAVMVIEKETEGIDYELLTADECVVITQRGHALLGRSEATLRQVLSNPLLSMDGHLALRRAVLAEAKKLDVEVRLAPEARGISNVMTLLAMAAAGLGVCIHPSSLIPPEMRPTIGVVKLSDCTIARSFGIATATGRKLGPAAAAFREFLRTEVRKRKIWAPTLRMK